jgi:hypothetical protein
MSSKSELPEFVLRAIADDYEYFEQIIEDVTGWASEHGVDADQQAIRRALEGLIKDGYAQSYVLSNKIEAVSYSADRLDELSFYLTPKGKELATHYQKKWRE